MRNFARTIAAAGFAFAGLGGTAVAHQHDVTAPALQLAEGTTPAAKCLNQRQACISAGTQTGANGVRYVPPDVVRQCYDSYRACTSRR